MVFKKYNNSYLLRFDYGENFIAKLSEFIASQNIDSGFFYGLGGANKAVLGIYRIDSDKEYHWHDFAGPLEISNLTGNIARKNGELAIHAHATISGTDFNASAGHVKEIEVAGTLEVYLSELKGLQRKHDEKVGLALLDFEEFNENS